ncbi:cell division protein FtsL [candidate division TA06 bacterium]|nr:cell division protein FtsL [candidate division TA06 bacterium]
MNRKFYRGNEDLRRRKKRSSKGRKNPYRLLLLLIVFGFFVLGIVWTRITITELTIRIGELEKERKEVANEVQRLELDISYLSSRNRIETLARETLGMRYPRLTEVSTLYEK